MATDTPDEVHAPDEVPEVIGDPTSPDDDALDQTPYPDIERTS